MYSSTCSTAYHQRFSSQTYSASYSHSAVSTTANSLESPYRLVSVPQGNLHVQLCAQESCRGNHFIEGYSTARNWFFISAGVAGWMILCWGFSRGGRWRTPWGLRFRWPCLVVLCRRSLWCGWFGSHRCWCLILWLNHSTLLKRTSLYSTPSGSKNLLFHQNVPSLNKSYSKLKLLDTLTCFKWLVKYCSISSFLNIAFC